MAGRAGEPMSEATANLQQTVPEPELAPYRPDESDRAERARRWIEQARGKGQQPKE
jgi:hypothetical protein